MQQVVGVRELTFTYPGEVFGHAKGRPESAKIEGTIEEMRVLDGGKRERWLFRIDACKDAELVFEPTAISPPPKRGQRVRVGFVPEPAEAGRLRADWIAAA